MIYVLICEPHGSEEIWDQVSLNLCESALLVDFMTGLNVMDHQFMRQFIYQFPIVTQVINNALNNVTCAKLFEMIFYYKSAILNSIWRNFKLAFEMEKQLNMKIKKIKSEDIQMSFASALFSYHKMDLFRVDRDRP